MQDVSSQAELDPRPPADQRGARRRPRAAVVAAVITATGVVVAPVTATITAAVVNSNSASRPAPPPQISITAPLNGAHVELSPELTGTVRNLRILQVVWAYTEPVTAQGTGTGEFTPQPGPCPVTNGTWTCHLFQAGLPGDSCKTFDIWVAIVTDDQVYLNINEEFNQYRNGPPFSYDPNIGPPHAGGTQAINNVSVTRNRGPHGCSRG